MKKLFLITLAALIATPAAADDSLSNAVEHQLGTAIEIAGAPAQRRSLSEAMAEAHVPGISIAVIRDGRIEWVGGYGHTFIGGEAITPDTSFQAGSISKSIAALAILKLVADGRVSLDTPVNTYLSRWSLPDSGAGVAQDVTLRRLLSHTAGTNVHGFPGYARDGALPSLIDVLDGKPPANTPAVRIADEPGRAWRYSGGGYAIAQQVVVDATDRPFEGWAEETWLGPAGMTASGFGKPPSLHLALGHEADGTLVSGGYHDYPEQAAAGLWSTPSDLSRALLELYRSLRAEPGALLPQGIARVAVEPIVAGHSVGFDTGGTQAGWIAKGGDTEGFAAYLAFYPERGDGAVVMTNGAQGATLARDVIRAIAVAENWPDFGPRKRQVEATPANLLAALPGTYAYRETNEFTIGREGDILTISSPGEQPERLYHDPSGAFFTLSQDVDFLFDDGATTGHIQVGDTAIAFRKREK